MPFDYQQRVVICCGVYCNLGGRADALRRTLETHAHALNTAHDDAGKWNEPRPLQIRTATCLSMCGQGPSLILHPAGVTANDLDADSLQAFINTYLSPEADDR